MTGDQPGFVVASAERRQRIADLFGCSEALDPQELLLQGSHEALGDAVTFRSPDEARRGFDSKESKLTLEMPTHVLASMIVTETQASGDSFGEFSEVLSDSLLDRDESLEAAPLRRQHPEPDCLQPIQ